MSMLLIDIGNSRVKWALADGPDLVDLRAAPHDGQPAKALRALPLPRARVVWLAHVLGPVHEARLHKVIHHRYGIRPRIARSQDEWGGLHVAYPTPARLGVDRFLAMLGLWATTKKPFCVAMAGTALTFDAVDARGRHQGGLIAPGLTTAWNAVREATRFALPERPGRYARGLGRNTEACVRQGTLYTCAGAIARAARVGGGARFLSGGDAATLRPHLEGKWTERPHIVLEGLLAYAREWAWVNA
jgi:type III pantothenate kinase